MYPKLACLLSELRNLMQGLEFESDGSESRVPKSPHNWNTLATVKLVWYLLWARKA